MKYLQKLGSSLMLPVAVLPAAAILLGIGYWIDPSGWGANSSAAAFLIKAGGAIIDNMAILFAVGVAYGMSKDKDGSAAVSGLVAYLVITTLLSSKTVAMFTGADANVAFEKIQNAFIGILSGLIASYAYNRFSKVVLPQALAFFSGKRLVPIVTAGLMIVISVVLFFIWLMCYTGLVKFGTAISSLGAVGAGIYGFFNRLLIPTGLHHALNSVFWFDAIDINDITNFWNGTGTKGVTGMYQAGFFPIMMFGLPGAALAMYRCAKPEKRKVVGGILLAGAVSSFLTGVTEPLEFSFMFLSPILYVVHALLTGVSVFLAATFHWTAGFGFSAGLIDFILSCRLPLANKPFMLFILGLGFAVVYYFVFTFMIKTFNLMTPGRENEDQSEELEIQLPGGTNFEAMAEKIYEALGGKENIKSIDNCITRLRIEVKDSSNVNEKKIKAAGASGVIRPSKGSVQVVIGPQVQFVADAMKHLNI